MSPLVAKGDPVRIALAKLLKADQGLKDLATGGIFHLEAKNADGSKAVPPYVIFHRASDVPLWAFDGPPMDRHVWVVKGVGERAVAESIDRRCREILDGATLDIEGKAHQDLRHISGIDFNETPDGERYDHVGAEYKLDSEYE